MSNHPPYIEDVIRAVLEAAATCCTMQRGSEKAVADCTCMRCTTLMWAANEIRSIDPSTIEVSSPWISVCERLPHNEQTVWTNIGECTWYGPCVSWPDGTFIEQRFHLETNQITHWMPLPPLPEERE